MYQNFVLRVVFFDLLEVVGIILNETTAGIAVLGQSRLLSLSLFLPHHHRPGATIRLSR